MSTYRIETIRAPIERVSFLNLESATGAKVGLDAASGFPWDTRPAAESVRRALEILSGLQLRVVEVP